jgi:putative pyruvate formate lyase activating enzyme
MMRNSENPTPDFSGYKHCLLCPRQCGVDRLSGQKGFCGESGLCKVGHIGPHFGEEPAISGRRGSGTIFFSGCSCGCFFCQNYQLSLEHIGQAMTFSELLERVLKLAERGVHNLNFVTPEHWWPHIRELCHHLRLRGVETPFLWNSSGFCCCEMLVEQCKYIDIFLPDFKYADASLAERCMGRSDYPELALAGLRLMIEKKGFLRPFDSSGELAASQGVMVRHLVLPGEIGNSIRVLKILSEEFGEGLPLSLMRQFTPMPECERRQFLNRRVHDEEYAEVCAMAAQLRFRRVFLQGYPDGSFLPDFKQPEQPFPGNQ